LAQAHDCGHNHDWNKLNGLKMELMALEVFLLDIFNKLSNKIFQEQLQMLKAEKKSLEQVGIRG
jgi:hypothetical protein